MSWLRSIKVFWRALRDPDMAKAALAQGEFWAAQVRDAADDRDFAILRGDRGAEAAATARMKLAKERFEKETEALLKP